MESVFCLKDQSYYSEQRKTDRKNHGHLPGGHNSDGAAREGKLEKRQIHKNKQHDYINYRNKERGIEQKGFCKIAAEELENATRSSAAWAFDPEIAEKITFGKIIDHKFCDAFERKYADDRKNIKYNDGDLVFFVGHTLKMESTRDHRDNKNCQIDTQANKRAGNSRGSGSVVKSELVGFAFAV